MSVQIGPKIGIEGEKEYRSQINQIIQQIKTLDSAMEATTSTWDENTSAMTKNKAQAQQTAQKIELTQNRLTAMQGMLEQSAAKFGENSTATLKWQQAVDSCTASLNSMQQKLKSLKGAENFSDLSTKFADMGTKMQNVGQTLTSVGQKMTTSLTLPIAAAATASVKLASDLEEASSKVDVTFGNMSQSVKAFADDALNSYGLASGTAMQMAGTFGAMATSMGMSQQQAASMSTSLTALAADMASFYNVSVEVAQTSLQGVFTGETEALKKFGIVMTQTNLEQFAEQQGKVYNKMSEAEKVMTRYAFVMDATKNAQGDFARTSDGTANSLRVFQESLKELGAAFGESILPVITPVIQAITSFIQKIAALPAPVRNVIAVIALLVAAIGPVIMIIGTLISSFGSIVAAAPAVATAITTVAAAVTGLDLALAPAIGVVLAIAAAFALAFAAGAAIAANWDSITAAASNMAQSVSSAISSVKQKLNTFANSVSNMVQRVAGYIRELPSKIVNALRDAVDGVKQEFANMISNAKQSGQDFVEGFVDGIKQKVQKIIDAVKDIAETIEEYLGFSCPDKGPLSKYETWMPDFMNGLAKGINQNKGVVTNALKGLTKSMVLPLDTTASMNMAITGSNGGYAGYPVGNTVMNINVDHISELNDLLRIQNQAQQRLRMGAR